MATTVLGVGTGVFVIAAVWIVALVLCTALLRADGSVKLGVIPVFLMALTISLALGFSPRTPEIKPAFKEKETLDSLFIARYVLLALVSVIFLMALFMLLPFHFLEPIYAKALRTR